MLKSMTGFGRSRYENDAREYIVEIKSVNNRYSDISIKIPRGISYAEETIKKLISNAITRGKVEVFITFNNNSEKGKNIELNKELANKYISLMRTLAEETNINSNIEVMDVMKMPDVLNISINEEDEEIIEKELLICTKDAINNFINMRHVEGNKIKEDLEKRINNITEKINKITSISSGLVNEYVVKLEKRINELLAPNIVDETRLAQEIVIYSDKCSIEEELTRLNSHVMQFLNLLDSNEACGKKIDF